MGESIFVTGTGTDVGKTVVSAILARGLGWKYWKPVQSGAMETTDAAFVGRWIGERNISPSTYVFKAPLSPHAAAALEGRKIQLAEIAMPTGRHIIEGAGGVLVPLNDEHMVIDLIAKLDTRPLIVAASALGTINHTLLTLEALRSRRLEPLGVILVGDKNPGNREAIARYGRTHILGEIEFQKDFTPAWMDATFARLQWPKTEALYAHA